MACTSRCRGGRLERAGLTAGCRQPDAVSDLKTFTALLRARHVYIPVIDDAPFETLLEYCCGGIIFRSLRSAALPFSVPITLSHPSRERVNPKYGFSGFERSTAANVPIECMNLKLNVDSAGLD